MTKIKQVVMMLSLTIILLVCIASRLDAQSAEKEKAVKAYYSGFENKDWNTVAAQFADGFTFTSPKDDHISLEKFKEGCWPTSRFFKKVDFIKITEIGNDIMLLVQISTTDNKIVRNIDMYSFSAGKIKSIEVFFGLGQGYPGNPDNTK
jgi:hypothetical protein